MCCKNVEMVTMVLLAIHIYNSAKKTEKNIASAIRRKKNNPYIYGTKAHLIYIVKKAEPKVFEILNDICKTKVKDMAKIQSLRKSKK